MKRIANNRFFQRFRPLNRRPGVVILGCGRSGSSILGECFEHLRGIDYLFEPQLEIVSKQVVAHPDCRLVVKIPKGGPSPTPGLACDMDALVGICPRPFKIVWIVRHPLDTICSLRPGIEQGWKHNPKPPNHAALEDFPWHVKCAHHWTYINNEGYTHAARYGQIKVVCYESLINRKQVVVPELLKWCEINYRSGELAKYLDTIRDDVSGTHHAKHQTVWFRHDHERRIARHRLNMSRFEQQESWGIVKDTAARFGYHESMDAGMGVCECADVL